MHTTQHRSQEPPQFQAGKREALILVLWFCGDGTKWRHFYWNSFHFPLFLQNSMNKLPCLYQELYQGSSKPNLVYAAWHITKLGKVKCKSHSVKMRWSQLARDCRFYCRMSDPKLWGKLTGSNYTSWSKEMTLGFLAHFHTPDILIVIIGEYSYLNKPILHCNPLTRTIKTIEMLTYMAKHHWNWNLCCLTDFFREGCTSGEWLIRKEQRSPAECFITADWMDLSKNYSNI